ncbi:MAG: DUF389 domain-containing protein [Bryobacterales bacterium]
MGLRLVCRSWLEWSCRWTRARGPCGPHARGPRDLALATASGAAGVLAFTTGVPASLIGVMVAVALLPAAALCSGYL